MHGETVWPPERCLFRDEADRKRFIERLGERVEQFHVCLYAFVCMQNHFHLVFETPQANCSRFMQSVTTAYTVYHNLRHRRHGHLLDGRFKAKLVEGDAYLLALSRYVHLNPVQVGAWKDAPIAERIAALRAYTWSSYPGYIGEGTAYEFVECGPLLSQMAGRERDWPKRYREFVETGLAETDEKFKQALKQSPRSIGGAGFRGWVDELYQQRVDGQASREDASFRKITEPMTAAEVLDVVGKVLNVGLDAFTQRRRNSPFRAVAVRALLRYAGMSQREVAAALRIGSGAAVCNQLSRLDDRMAADRQLGRRVEEVERELASAWRARKTAASG